MALFLDCDRHYEYQILVNRVQIKNYERLKAVLVLMHSLQQP
ncbi:MAG: hypothetical protein RMY35_002295 [Nostoc sp. DedSLP01]|nr:hypothetical protein [Nostoc sp. DedSLP05]